MNQRLNGFWRKAMTRRLLVILLLTLPSWAVAATKPNWPVVEKEATTYFQQYLRIDTTNPPGNETAGAKFLQSLLEKEAIRCRLLESKPGRGNLFAYIDTGGKKAPLILLNHIDVVSAEKKYWKEDPFSGIIKDGEIWGRGATDNKNLGIAELMTMLLLRRNKVKLNRTIFFLAVADEEGGSTAGSAWITSEHHSLIEKAQFLLNEGSVITMKGGQPPVYGVSPAEKAVCWLELRAVGPAGHGAFPPFEPSAIQKLMMALNKIQAYKTDIVLTPGVEKYFQDLSKIQLGPRKLQFLKIRESLKDPAFAQEILKDPAFNAVLRNTVAVTSLSTSSAKVNIIPAEASATLDCRLLPGENSAQFVAKLQELVKGTNIEIHPIVLGESSSSPIDTELFRAIAKVASSYDKGALVTTPLLPSSTDSTYFRKLGITCYGFEPFKLTEEQELGHAHNERISVSSFLGGVRRMYDLVLAMQ